MPTHCYILFSFFSCVLRLTQVRYKNVLKAWRHKIIMIQNFETCLQVWDSFVVSCNVSWRDTTSGRGPCVIDRLILQMRQTWWITLYIKLCPLTAKFCLHLVISFPKLERSLLWFNFFQCLTDNQGNKRKFCHPITSFVGICLVINSEGFQCLADYYRFGE